MTHAELTRQQDAAAYRLMQIDFMRLSADFPAVSKILIARNCGARVFGIPVDALIAKSAKWTILRPRMKVIAAVCVLIPDGNKHAIARAFDRDHSCVYCAIERYGADVQQALMMDAVAA